MNNIIPPHPALSIGYKPEKIYMNDKQRIEQAMISMAKIITLYGESYLPIFERLEKELETYQQKQSTLQRATELAKQSVDNFGE